MENNISKDEKGYCFLDENHDFSGQIRGNTQNNQNCFFEGIWLDRWEEFTCFLFLYSHYWKGKEKTTEQNQTQIKNKRESEMEKWKKRRTNSQKSEWSTRYKKEK